MTPAMQQFVQIKSDYPDHIVLFRMGDFYETFYDDAKISSQILGITLTARDRERKVPMAGIPFHALDNYLSKLIDANKKVVLVEQLEDPKEAKGVVKRGIVKIFTPGTTSSQKDLKRNTFLAAIHSFDSDYHLAFLDLSEGKIKLIRFNSAQELLNNLTLIDAREILVEKESELHNFLIQNSKSSDARLLNQLESSHFEKVESDLIHSNLKKEIDKIQSKAIHSLVNYLTETERTNLDHITQIETLSIKSNVYLDSNVARNLELVDPQRKDSTSLWQFLDRCSTTNGSKLLRSWILSPLTDIKKIESRQNAIQSVLSLGNKSSEYQELLCGIHDLNRIASKIGLTSANARDLRNLLDSIKIIFDFKTKLLAENLSEEITALLNKIDKEVTKSQKILSEINKTITETPPLSVREGGMIQTGIDKDLDKLHELKTGGHNWLKTFEQDEIKRSGISTLKVRFNKVFGYYIEISKLQSDKAPENYIRKQTLVNAERYITPELKEHEANVLGAEDRIAKIEFEIFNNLLTKTKSIIPSIQNVCELVSELDIYFAIAEISSQNSWIKPEVNESDSIHIEGGRHPVIEHLLKKEGKLFVKNSVEFSENSTLFIVTGPNMGGKSTYLRQNALIVLLAQIGSFVPADSASIGVVDKIFTRVGASDNLTAGESTFMVEMLEAASILKNATSKSLVILDEVGRGTSTFDGMSIAWAICETLAQKNAKTLFATHYHELTELANKFPNVKNLSVKVVDYQGEIVFLHQIIKGKADKSYGIHVAKLAGLPDKVIKNAEKVLKLLEKEKNKLQPKPTDLFTDEVETPESKTNNPELIEKIKNIDLNKISPMELVQIVQQIQKELN